MIFVDTNVFMYAVGRPHPLQGPARLFFSECVRNQTPLVTSAEVLQELVHAYIPARRLDALDAAIMLLKRFNVQVWPLEEEDVTLARQFHEQYPGLQAHDLCRLACCRRRGVRDIKTFDQDLARVSGPAPA